MPSLKAEALRFPIILTGCSIFILEALAWEYAPDHHSAFTIVGVLVFVVAIALCYWYAGRLVLPLVRLLPVIDEEGKLELAGYSSGKLPDELKHLTETVAQISDKQQRDLEARQKLERVRSEFLANVSHELRTPIFAVQGFIETLLNGAIDDPQVNRNFLERAHVQAERLNSLLNDLIDISRIESGEMRMSFRNFDVQPFLRDLTREMLPQAKSKNIDFYFTGNVLPHHEVSVYADKDRIKQVLINLIDNAIKYSEPGSAIKLELLDREPDAKQVTIRVTDTGIGIAPEHISRLFERFYRVDKGRARSAPGGTGLGLAIVKHLVEAHHGRIQVTSEPKKGSTFQFTLHKDPF